MSALRELLKLCRERGMDTDAIEVVKQEVITCGVVAKVHHEGMALNLLNVLAAYDTSVSKIKPFSPSSIEKNFISSKEQYIGRKQS